MPGLIWSHTGGETMANFDSVYTIRARLTVSDEEAEVLYGLLNMYCAMNRNDVDFHRHPIGCKDCVFFDYDAGFCKFRNQTMGKKNHDGCVNCKFEDKSEDEDPCVRCKQRYVDQWRGRSSTE